MAKGYGWERHETDKCFLYNPENVEWVTGYSKAPLWELNEVFHWSLSQGRIQKFLKEGAPEAIIHKILERGGPNSLKMAFECSFQSFSYKSFANIPPKEGGGGPCPLGPTPKSATELNNNSNNNWHFLKIYFC